MNLNFLFGVSLTASFLAGVLALFAPCCITFLFPSYLGTIFKAKRKVMAYTLIFALGLAFVLVPISLGFRAVVFFLDTYHLQVYYLGALIMILMGVMTLKPIFHLPQYFHVRIQPGQPINAASVFALGLMSGLTSACLRPGFVCRRYLNLAFTDIIAGFNCIFGLCLRHSDAVIYHVLRLYPGDCLNFRPQAPKTLSNSEISRRRYFFLTGILIAVFNFQGKIQMNQMEPYSQKIRLLVFEIAKYFQNPPLDLLVFSIIIFIFYKLLRYKINVEK